MRIKSSPGMESRILDSPRYIKNHYEYKNKWNEYFGNLNEIHAELGMGKGDFLLGTAMANPDVNFIGLEKYMMVIARAAGKLDAAEVKNVVLVIDDIENLPEITGGSFLKRIYLNFPDPWPKKRHEKRRCTNKRFLDIYKTVLCSSGQLHFKTDNEALYDYTLESIASSGFRILLNTPDLYNSEHFSGNIQSEYEKKFSSLGFTIKKIVAERG